MAQKSRLCFHLIKATVRVDGQNRDGVVDAADRVEETCVHVTFLNIMDAGDTAAHISGQVRSCQVAPCTISTMSALLYVLTRIRAEKCLRGPE
jgi:hypothetical protein